MIKNENIICISSIDWDFIWQGHQEIMSTFARQGNRVLFIENTGVRSPTVKDVGRILKRIKNWSKSVKGYRKIEENLYLFSPVVLPFPYSRVVRKLNQIIINKSLSRWKNSAEFYSPIIWTFLPTGLAIDIVKGVNNKASIYYCIDNFRESSKAAKKIAKYEKEMIERADLVFVTSSKLFNYVSQFKDEDKIKLFPFGVNIDNYEKIRKEADEVPDDISDISHPVIGYIGGVHKWIDQELVEYAAKELPDYSFLFVGPIQCNVDRLKSLKNIYFPGMKQRHELPHYVNDFDVGIIPYLLTKYTENVYPTKLNEYLSMGKPVVSTALPEIQYFNEQNGNIVSISTTKEAYVKNLQLALNCNSRDKEKRISVAENNSWERKIENMSDIINSAIIDNKIRRQEYWQDKIIAIYTNHRRKLAGWIIAPALIYLLLFYSPLFRILANPLIISQLPQKADAIAVIGGGAGESGVPGQGYEERVQRAVDLYKKGFAKKIIYSSGYTFMFKEPDVMKAISISNGVPGEDIILDTSSTNTYENVVSISRILGQNKWDEILLVSSPYHMLRTSLVFKGNSPNIEVIYTPIFISKFHDYNAMTNRKFFKKTTWKQIKSFLHEYLGIVYYWWKGYL